MYVLCKKTVPQESCFLILIAKRASRAKTIGLLGGQLNTTRSIAAGRKIPDRAVQSVM